MAQLTVGLDLGSETIKLVRLRSTFRTVEIVDFQCIDIPQDERPLGERMAKAFRQLEGSSQVTDLMATTLPGDEVSIRSLTLPFSDSRRISQTVGFELENVMPFSLDQVVFDYLMLGKTEEGGSRLLVALCQTKLMEHWLEILQDSGLDPRLVGADCLAYSSLASHLPPAEEGHSTAIVDIGNRLTSICIMGPDGVEFARTLSGGGEDITEKIASAFKVDFSEAERAKLEGVFVECSCQSAENPEQVLISDAIRRSIDSMIREIRQTFSAHQAQLHRPLTKLWLCGGGATIENLDTYLEEQLGLEVERVRTDLFDLEGIDRLCNNGSQASGWAKSLGLALHAHNGGRHGWLNLRRSQFAYKGDFSGVHGKVLQVVVILLILAFLALGKGLVSYFSLRSTDRTLDRRMQEVTKAILGKSYDNPEVAISIIREKVSPEADKLPTATGLDSLREIHSRLPEEAQLRMKSLTISPTKIRLEGFSDSFETVTVIKTALEQYDCFTKIQTGNTRRTKDGSEVEFELTIVNGC